MRSPSQVALQTTATRGGQTRRSLLARPGPQRPAPPPSPCRCRPPHRELNLRFGAPRECQKKCPLSLSSLSKACGPLFAFSSQKTYLEGPSWWFHLEMSAPPPPPKTFLQGPGGTTQYTHEGCSKPVVLKMWWLGGYVSAARVSPGNMLEMQAPITTRLNNNRAGGNFWK